MAWTQLDLDTIEKAIASGTRLVRLDNRTIEYQSISQMLNARDAIKAKLLEDLNPNPRPRVYRVRQCKGL
jgi:hypothetical protein